MKRVLLTLLLIFGVVSVGFAEPRIYVEEQNFDFGYSPQNSTLKHAYLVKNIGTDTLRITRVKPG